MKEGSCWYVNKVIGYFINHHHFGITSSVLQGLPACVLNHLTGAACMAIVTEGKVGGSSLDSFNFLDVSLRERVPNCGCVFQRRPNHGLIALGLDVSWAT